MNAAHTPGPWVMEPASFQKPRVPIKVAHAVLKAGSVRLADVRLAVDAKIMVEALSMLEALRAAQSIEDDMVRNGSMLTAEHEQRSIAAAEMRRSVLKRIDG